MYRCRSCPEGWTVVYFCVKRSEQDTDSHNVNNNTTSFFFPTSPFCEVANLFYFFINRKLLHLKGKHNYVWKLHKNSHVLSAKTPRKTASWCSFGIRTMFPQPKDFEVSEVPKDFVECFRSAPDLPSLALQGLSTGNQFPLQSAGRVLIDSQTHQKCCCGNMKLLLQFLRPK